MMPRMAECDHDGYGGDHDADDDGNHGDCDDGGDDYYDGAVADGGGLSPVMTARHSNALPLPWCC